MEIDPIKLSPYIPKPPETQSQVSVPLWFLEAIGDSESVQEIEGFISEMENSSEEDMCKQKSIHLAKIRIKFLNYAGSTKKK